MRSTGHASENSAPATEPRQAKPGDQLGLLVACAVCVVCALFGALVSALAVDRPGTLAAPEESVSSADGVADDAPLRGASPSLTAIGEAVVAGLAADDRDALAGLLVDRRDFQGRLFDALSNHPAAAQMGSALLWDMQAREGADELDRALREYGGRPLVLRSVEVDAVERRQEIVIHRRPRLSVVDSSNGEVLSLQILGSVIEHVSSGSFVLLTYRFREAP